jgi:hypothetical protein
MIDRASAHSLQRRAVARGPGVYRAGHAREVGALSGYAFTGRG